MERHLKSLVLSLRVRVTISSQKHAKIETTNRNDCPFLTEIGHVETNTLLFFQPTAALFQTFYFRVGYVILKVRSPLNKERHVRSCFSWPYPNRGVNVTFHHF